MAVLITLEIIIPTSYIAIITMMMLIMLEGVTIMASSIPQGFVFN